MTYCQDNLSEQSPRFGGRANVALLQESFKGELLSLLEQCPGPKALIWDEWLAGPVGLVAQYSVLKDHGVIEMFPLKPGVLPSINVKNIIFITRTKVHLMDLVAAYIQSVSQASTALSKKQFHLLFVPRRSDWCEMQLTNKRVMGKLSSVKEFKCDIFPFDGDLLSLELQNDFREYQLEGDPSCLNNAAQALKTLQNIYGVIPKVFGKGQAAKQVWDLLLKINKEERSTAPKVPGNGCIDQLLLLDRSIDLTSVLATQLTYEGLIDEIFGIKSTTAILPGEKFVDHKDQATSVATPEKKRIILNSGEELFAQIRDKNFSAVGPALSQIARIMTGQQEDRLIEKTVQEIKQYVSRLPQMLANKQSLAIHTFIADNVKEAIDTFEFQDTIQCEGKFLNCIDNDKPSPFIENLIAQKAPLTKVLRLICLQNVTGSGLKPKLLEYYKRELVQVYGMSTWLSLCNLEKCGLLKVQTGIRQYSILRKVLRLTTEKSEREQTQFSTEYFTSKYTPLTVRLAEHIAKNKGWAGTQDFMGILPGPTIEETQINPRQTRRNSISSETSMSSESLKLTLVFFIGGCTYNEISALRSFYQQEDSNVEFLILTTKLINGNTLIESLLETEK